MGNVIADLAVENNQVETGNIIIKTDSKTGIKLEAQKDIITDDTIIDVIEIVSGEIFEKIKDVLAELKNVKSYDITLKSNGTAIQPNGKVRVSIPIPNGFNVSKLVVYRVEEDGSKTKYQVEVSNGYATFETDHFSIYVLGEVEETTTGKNDTKLPQTGEETNVFAKWLSIVIILGIFWITSMFFIEREKKKMIKR